MEQYIAANKHLPDVPGDEEVAEKGYSLRVINALFLQKIEELTLYAIEQEKTINQLKEEQAKTQQLEERLAKLEALLQSTDK